MQIATARSRPARGADSPDRLFVFDIETVPDERLLPDAWPDDKFPKPAWHKVVCISFVEARIVVDPDTGLETYLVDRIDSGGDETWDEGRLVRGFWRHFDGARHRAVTWNGRCFDVPVLQMRAFVHGIALPNWFGAGSRWEGYGKRYASDWHADLMDMLSGYGAAPKSALDDVAAAMGLPGKGVEHGSDVARYVADGDLARVRRYCETDVLNLFALYIRWSLVTGRSDVDGHDRGIASLVALLRNEGRARPHLMDFLNQWRASDRPAPMAVAGARP